jgi:hypothetical protein
MLVKGKAKEVVNGESLSSKCLSFGTLFAIFGGQSLINLRSSTVKLSLTTRGMYLYLILEGKKYSAQLKNK